VTARPLGAALILVALTGCGGERARPGPPSLTLQLPPGNVVATPDTFAIQVFARDDNGLDSLIVRFLDQTRDVPAFNEREVTDVVLFVVPEGLAVGEVIDVQGYARDLVGERTLVTSSVTVVARDTTAP